MLNLDPEKYQHERPFDDESMQAVRWSSAIEPADEMFCRLKKNPSDEAARAALDNYRHTCVTLLGGQQKLERYGIEYLFLDDADPNLWEYAKSVVERVDEKLQQEHGVSYRALSDETLHEAVDTIFGDDIRAIIEREQQQQAAAGSTPPTAEAAARRPSDEGDTEDGSSQGSSPLERV